MTLLVPQGLHYTVGDAIDDSRYGRFEDLRHDSADTSFLDSQFALAPQSLLDDEGKCVFIARGFRRIRRMTRRLRSSFLGKLRGGLGRILAGPCRPSRLDLDRRYSVAPEPC